MEVTHIKNGNKGSFKATNNDQDAGEMTYVFAGESKFIIDHTEVNEAFAGQGVGLKMVLASVDFARKNNLKILPLCPFARSVFDKRPELGDVLS